MQAGDFQEKILRSHCDAYEGEISASAVDVTLGRGGIEGKRRKEKGGGSSHPLKGRLESSIWNV